MTKYDPLRTFLEHLPTSKNDVTISFDKIAEILQSDLPYSANQYSAWWSNEVNGQHVQAHAWMNAGWKVESVDFNRKIVRFIRFA